ncbi:MAG: nucleoside deaminase [Geobacteraceae bacterium]|nr:nucleoside deaminase [Geobacteraceae bacterium]
MENNPLPMTADFCFTLPAWVQQLTADTGRRKFLGDEEKMEWVLELGRYNIEDGGGPFAAAVFSLDHGTLVAAGVNRVMASNCSVLHAEICAIMLAQQQLGSYTLAPEPGEESPKGYELVTSTEPCAMCLGAIPWAGIKRLVCGARDADARAIGFDEGDKPERWTEKLEQRSIAVQCDVCRIEATALLKEYLNSNGKIYNG